MGISQKILLVTQVGILFLLTLFLQCTKSMEPKPLAGYDIQKYISSNFYQSLYIKNNNTDFVIISNGKRITGQLTNVEHEKILNLLQKENWRGFYENSILDSDTLSYPFISIRKRAEPIFSSSSDFFVILPLDTTENFHLPLINLVNNLLEKYNG